MTVRTERAGRPGKTEAAAKREALVYVPGLAALSNERKTVSGVVRRLQVAMDVEAASGPATWRIEWHDKAVARRGGSVTEPIATISRKEPAGDERPVLDVFQYEYSDRLVDGWEQSSLFKRAGRALLALVVHGGAVFRGYGAARRSVRGRRQFTVALLLFLLMLVYAAVLAVAAAQTAQQLVQVASGEEAAKVLVPDTPSPSPTPEPDGPSAGAEASPGTPEDEASTDEKPAAGITVFQWLAIAGSLIVAAVKKEGDRLRHAGASLFAVNSYLRVAERQPELMGGLRSLCEALREEEKYTAVRVVGYSFGSILALDALFPTTAPPARAFEKVTSLVTIGSPYDFVLAVRPNWAERRHAPEGAELDWLNIYNPVDLLGANFRDDKTEGLATRGLGRVSGAAPLRPTHNVPWDLNIAMDAGDLATLYGFTSHGMYWGEDDVVDVNVFTLVVRHFYVGSEVLS